MKNISFSFGYYGTTRYEQITYKLCDKFKFLPSFYVQLFRTYHNSQTPFIVRHSLCFGVYKYMLEIRKVHGKWRIDFI